MIKHGCKVILTDVSFEMLKVARTKVGSNAQLINLPAEYIDSFKTKFDGAYSSFGVLNCITDVSSFFQKLHSILKPGSLFVASFINRWYWGDFIFFPLGITNYLKKRLKGWGYITLDGKEYNVIARFLLIEWYQEVLQRLFYHKENLRLTFFAPTCLFKTSRAITQGVLQTTSKNWKFNQSLLPI